MFIAFFSDHLYEKQDWATVFLMQNVIQATVREEWPYLADLSSKDLLVVLQQRLQEAAVSGYDTRCTLPESLVTDFLSREVSRVAALVKELKSVGRDFPTRHPPFALNEERLRTCMMESEEFRRYILEKRTDPTGVGPAGEKKRDSPE